MATPRADTCPRVNASSAKGPEKEERLNWGCCVDESSRRYRAIGAMLRLEALSLGLFVLSHHGIGGSLGCSNWIMSNEYRISGRTMDLGPEPGLNVRESQPFGTLLYKYILILLISPLLPPPSPPNSLG